MKDLVFEVMINDAHYQEGTIVLDPLARLPLGKVSGEAVLWLGEDKRPIRGWFEREGGADRTAAIHGGQALCNWLLEHCQPSDVLEVRVLGPVQFWLRQVQSA